MRGQEVIQNSELRTQNSPAPSPPHPLTSGFIAVAFSALLLIARAVFVAQVPITRLGLAVGIGGWVLGWLSRKRGESGRLGKRGNGTAGCGMAGCGDGHSSLAGDRH
ncbi:hypothetical protein [Leptothermofonsia sp. ETS-13]|uniref:hypothetical protein n=1 Tax=Leptothermofonsia sp. ETS-13 TaxID=3035696 RepID=UPI003B9E6DD4